MPKTLDASTHTGNIPWTGIGFAAAILSLTAALLAWHYHSRIADYRNNQQRLMQGNVNATAVEISNYVRHLRRGVKLFVDDRIGLIAELAGSPADELHYQQLRGAIGNHFPHHFAFTIANRNGTPLLQEMDELVGKGCRRDIRRFAQDPGGHRLYIHASPRAHPHHFDVMLPWSAPDGPGGVFFVSFFVSEIAGILRTAALTGHQLLLVREDRPHSIEVSSDGAGSELIRDPALSPREQSTIGASAIVRGTRWILYDLPNTELSAAFAARARKEAIAAFVLFTLASLIFLTLVYRAERALRRSNRDLALSLAQLQRAQDQLVRSEKLAALGGLVAGIAHEINTPVGTAMTAASHLEEERIQTLKALELGRLKKSHLQAFFGTTGEATRILLSNLERAAELIQSFKLVASDQTHQERRRFDLKTYLEEVMLSLHPKIKHSRHRFTLECPPGITLHGYPGALAQVVTNLLDNSLTHAFRDQPAGHARLTVHDHGERVTIEFSDDGRGMDAHTAKRIFDPFFTLNREHGGTGLGMHIVFNLVEGKLGGHIHCDSRPGHGTRITLDLPRQAPVDKTGAHGP